MSKYKARNWVMPNWVNHNKTEMIPPITMPEHIIHTPKYPISPRYDLKEFALAAMTSILKSESAWHDVAGIDEFGKMAVKIARATIKALQEAEKEVQND